VRDTASLTAFIDDADADADDVNDDNDDDNEEL
jgi:hypothetical protein